MIKVIAFDLGGTLLREKLKVSENARFLEPLFDDDSFYGEAIEHFGVAKPLIDKIVDEVIEEVFVIRDEKVFTAFPGYRLAIASNFSSRMRNFLEKLDMVKYFNPIVISAEVGVNKPDSKFFQILAEKIGEDPWDILFVDNLQVNVDAAAEFEFRVVKYNEGEDIVGAVKNKLEFLISN